MGDFSTRRRMMVDTQIRPSDVTEFPIIDAMLNVPRELYVPNHLIEAAYMSENLALGDDRMLLEPRSFAKMLDALNLTDKDLVLDVGVGLGYSSAVMARIVEAVVALEDDDDRVNEAQQLLSGQSVDNVIVHQGPLAQGAKALGPFDAIIIEGGIETFPDALGAQLKDGGRVIALFMEGALGTAKLGLKHEGRISWRYAFNAAAPVLQGFEKQSQFAL